MTQTQAEPGISVDVAAGIGLQIGNLANQVRALREERQAAWAQCHPVFITAQGASSGTIQSNDQLGPRQGLYWDVRRLAVMGFTAGSVTLYRNSTSAAPLYTWSAAGEKVWSSQLLLAPNEVLVFSLSGITGTVTIDGTAVEVATSLLPFYLL